MISDRIGLIYKKYAHDGGAKEENTAVLTIRVKKDVISNLELIAEELGITRNKIAAHLLEAASLDTMDLIERGRKQEQ